MTNDLLDDLPPLLEEEIDKKAGPLGREIMRYVGNKELLAEDILNGLLLRRAKAVEKVLLEMEREGLITRVDKELRELEEYREKKMTKEKKAEKKEEKEKNTSSQRKKNDKNDKNADAGETAAERLHEEKWMILSSEKSTRKDKKGEKESGEEKREDQLSPEKKIILELLKKGPLSLKELIEGWTKSSEKTEEIRIATVRKTLYELAKINMMDSRSQKLPGGKIVYHWRVTIDRGTESIRRRLQKEIKNVKSLLSKAETSNVFVCSKCSREVSFEEAMECEFVCSEAEGSIHKRPREGGEGYVLSCDNCGREYDISEQEEYRGECPYCVCDGEIIAFDEERKESLKERLRELTEQLKEISEIMDTWIQNRSEK